MVQDISTHTADVECTYTNAVVLDKAIVCPQQASILQTRTNLLSQYIDYVHILKLAPTCSTMYVLCTWLPINYLAIHIQVHWWNVLKQESVGTTWAAWLVRCPDFGVVMYRVFGTMKCVLFIEASSFGVKNNCSISHIHGKKLLLSYRPTLIVTTQNK